MKKHDITVSIDVYPETETDIFRIAVADDILQLLADAHDTEFTVPELVNSTDVARSTVWRALNLLESLGAIQIRETPQRNYVRINPTRLQKDDPILAIHQPTFHDPIRTFVTDLKETVTETAEITDLLGIVVFGSVARGDADRQSDIDLFVLIEGDRTTARRIVTDLVADLRDQRFNGDRFEFEPYVESLDSAQRADSKLRDIFAEGLTVYGTDELHELRKTVMNDE